MKKCLALIVFLFAHSLLFQPGSSLARGHEQRVERSFKVRSDGTLHLDSDKGSVEVQTHSSEEVEVVVFLKANTSSKDRAQEWFENFELDFDHRNGDVEIRGEWRQGWARKRNRLRVHFNCRVPQNYNLDIDTAGGGIRVDDLVGEVRLETSGGSISMGEIDGPVEAETSGGSISLDRCTGRASVHTSGGNITLGKIGGPVDARTSGGSISVDGVGGDLGAYTSGGSLRLRDINGNVRAKTSGGSIRAELLKQINSPVNLRTSGGGIILEIPPNFKADLDASTSGGRVVTDVPITIKGTVNKSSLRGELNGGGPLITLRTSGGNIEIRER